MFECISLVHPWHGNEPGTVSSFATLTKHSCSDNITSAILIVPVNFSSHDIVRILVNGVWLAFGLDDGSQKRLLQPLAKQLCMLFDEVVPYAFLISREFLVKTVRLVMDDLKNFATG